MGSYSITIEILFLFLTERSSRGLCAQKTIVYSNIIIRNEK